MGAAFGFRGLRVRRHLEQLEDVFVGLQLEVYLLHSDELGRRFGTTWRVDAYGDALSQFDQRIAEASEENVVVATRH